MAKTIEQLKAQGAEVKNATVVGENTATRVGTLFNDIVEHVEDYEAKQAERDKQQDNTAASLVNDERQRAISEEDKINKALASETARAKAAEEANATAITDETERAITEDKMNLEKCGNIKGLYNIRNRKAYIDAIKFIAFVPKDEYKEHTFGIYALSTRTNQYTDERTVTSFDLWLLNEDLTKQNGKETNAVKLMEEVPSDFTNPISYVVTGNHGTLYATIDWNILADYKASNKYAPLVWGNVNWNDPASSNLVRVNKINNDDPRIIGFNQAVHTLKQDVEVLKQDVEVLKNEVATISPIQFTDFTKLNFGVDGDSITVGNQWSYYVSQILNFNTHHNVGLGSASWACKRQKLNDVVYQTQEYDAEDFAGISDGWETTTDPIIIQKRCNNCAKVHIQKFIAEVTNGKYPEPDIFAFAMGTNDTDKTAADDAIATGTSYPSGDMLFTLAGAMKWCIQKIRDTYPSCKIYVLLPIQRYSGAGGNSANLEKIKIMKDVAKAFSVEVIDMFSNCGISSMLENGSGPYLRDGLHPNLKGQKLMGKYAASVIRNYILYN